MKITIAFMKLSYITICITSVYGIQQGFSRSASYLLLCWVNRLFCFQTITEQGVAGLFKGMGAPLATVAIFNAVLFSARGQMEKLLAHKDGEVMASS